MKPKPLVEVLYPPVSSMTAVETIRTVETEVCPASIKLKGAPVSG